MFTRRLLLWGAGLVMALQSWYYYARLPEQVASHFAADGTADGWSSRAELVGIMLAVGAVMVLMFEGLGWLMPRLPTEMLNIPNREYWLAPERRDETLERTRADLLEIGVLTMLWLITLNEIMMRANLGPTPMLGAWFWSALVLYLLAMGVWLTRMYRRYSRLPDAHGPIVAA